MRFGLFIAVALTLVTLSFGEQTQEDPLEFNSFLSELRASNDPDDSLFASLFEDQELQSSIEAVASIDYQDEELFTSGIAMRTLNAMKARLSIVASKVFGEEFNFMNENDVELREAQFECQQCVRLADQFVFSEHRRMFGIDYSSSSSSEEDLHLACMDSCESQWWWSGPACPSICSKVMNGLDSDSAVNTCVSVGYCDSEQEARSEVVARVAFEEGVDPHTIELDAAMNAVEHGRKAVVAGLAVGATKKEVQIPTVLMHGILAAAADDKWVGFKYDLDHKFPDMYVKLMEVGGGKWDSVFTPMSWQSLEFRMKVKDDAKLVGSKKGIHCVAHSQGTLVTRGFIQRYTDVKIRSFVALSGPQSGQSSVPYSGIKWVDKLVNKYAYKSGVQNVVTPAQYWRDPEDLNRFLDKSLFQADIDNYREDKNQQYFDRIADLDVWVMVKATGEKVISPRVAPHFGYYTPGSHKDTTDMRDTEIFNEDWIGLQELDSAGGIVQGEVDCTHTNICVHRDCPEAFEAYIYPFIGPVKADEL